MRVRSFGSDSLSLGRRPGRRFCRGVVQSPRRGGADYLRKETAARTASNLKEDGSDALYRAALCCARASDFEEAQVLFESYLSLQPHVCKAWVSYAQMMRRWFRKDATKVYDTPRRILQRGLQINPQSGCLTQAWGLLELKRGNSFGAVKLLERSVTLDPACSPVLKWKPVLQAKSSIQSNRGAKTAM